MVFACTGAGHTDGSPDLALLTGSSVISASVIAMGSRLASVLICLAAVIKYQRLRVLNNTYLFLTVLEAGSLRSECLGEGPLHMAFLGGCRQGERSGVSSSLL